MMNIGTLRGPAKLSAVNGLLDKLAFDLKEHNLSPEERDAALEELKIYGRDPRDAEPIFTRRGISMLAAHSFDGSLDTTSRNALRCLANAMFLDPTSRSVFVELEFHIKACAKLTSDSWDDEFLVSRVLMLASNAPHANFEVLVTQHDLAELIVTKLENHASSSPDEGSSSSTMEGMALCETLKLLFSVVHFCPGHQARFTAVVPPILTMICRLPIPVGDVFAPPCGHLINALSGLDLRDKAIQHSLFPENDPSSTTNKMIEILDRALREYGGNSMNDATIAVLVVSLCEFFEVAPKSVRSSMQDKLLPTDDDRSEVLGETESLPSRLLKMTTNALAPKSQKVIPHLLFDLSDRDAAIFVGKVGYGYASGFLFENKIPVPQSALGGGDSSGAAGQGRAVNPVTGQFLDAEKLLNLPEMSPEEKEREAERLFVLFERLKKTGIVNVQNPVEQAFQEGRIQELEDDEEEEDMKKQ